MSLRELKRARPPLPRFIGGEPAASVEDLIRRQRVQPRKTRKGATFDRDGSGFSSSASCQHSSTRAGKALPACLPQLAIAFRGEPKIGLGQAVVPAVQIQCPELHVLICACACAPPHTHACLAGAAQEEQPKESKPKAPVVKVSPGRDPQVDRMVAEEEQRRAQRRQDQQDQHARASVDTSASTSAPAAAVTEGYQGHPNYFGPGRPFQVQMG